MSPEHRYSIGLYQGAENYDVLKKMLDPMLSYLWGLQESGYSHERSILFFFFSFLFFSFFSFFSFLLFFSFLFFLFFLFFSFFSFFFFFSCNHIPLIIRTVQCRFISFWRLEISRSGAWDYCNFLLLLLSKPTNKHETQKSAAAEDGSCIWCFTSASERYCADTNYSICRDLKKILAEFQKCGSSSDPGQERPPIFDFIPFQRVMLDPLHLLLRIAGKLQSLLFNDLLSKEEGKCGQCFLRGKVICKPGCKHACHISIRDCILSLFSFLSFSLFFSLSPCFFFFSSGERNAEDRDLPFCFFSR